ncbi:MAG: hypothetical protein WCF85_22000 [Rhodospirillaceae bacterium]
MIDFALKLGPCDEPSPAPPFVAIFKIAPDNVPLLREKASLILQASGGRSGDEIQRARRFISSTVLAKTLYEAGIKETVAAVLVLLCTDTPERLSMVQKGKVSRVGYVLAPERLPDVASALKNLRMPVGGGIISAAVPDVMRFRFRYFACLISQRDDGPAE